jgi:hypothetical protein
MEARGVRTMTSPHLQLQSALRIGVARLAKR